MNNKEAIKHLQKRLNENAQYNRIAGRKITDPYYKHNVLKYRLALLYAIKAVRDIDNTPDVFYLCDHKACIKGITFGAVACDPCGHTSKIRHAANFDPLYDNDGRVLAYFEHAQTDEDERTNPVVTECREIAIDNNLPLYFVYYEETGVFEVYITDTKELFEKRHCAKHLSSYKFNDMATRYLDDYLNWKEVQNE